MKYAVGQLVMNRKLGLGKILEIDRDNVTTFFKDQAENPRVINVAIVPMEIAKEQSDEFLDDPNLLRKHGRAAGAAKRAPRARRTPVAKVAVAVVA